MLKSVPQRVRTAAVAVPPRLDSARTAVMRRDGPGLVFQDQLPRELMEAVPIRVTARPGVTSYSTTVPAAVLPGVFEVPANSMSFLSRCLAVVILTTSF